MKLTSCLNQATLKRHQQNLVLGFASNQFHHGQYGRFRGFLLPIAFCTLQNSTCYGGLGRSASARQAHDDW